MALTDTLASRPVVELGPHSTWTDGSKTYQVVGLTVDNDEVLYSVWGGGDDYRTITVTEALEMMLEAKWILEPELLERADDDELLQSLNDEQYNRVLKLEGAILEATTGFPFHVPPAGAKPRPQYDPERVGKTARMQAMAKELGMSQSSFYELRKRYGERGPVGLVHGNKKARPDVLALYDEDTVEFVRAFIAKQLPRSTRYRTSLRPMLAVEMEEAGLAPLSVHRADQLLDELSRGQHLFGNSGTRETSSLRPDQMGSRVRVGSFGEVIEADAMQMDFKVWSPSGQGWLSVWGIFMTDRCTKLCSVRLTTSPPDSRAFALALARMMQPPPTPDMARPWRFAPVAPREVLLKNPSDWGPFVPGELHIDNGREGQNGRVFSIAARLGITINPARPHQPTDKPNAESGIRGLHTMTQLLEGYTGGRPHKRGKHPEKEHLLTFDVAQAVMDEVCLAAMYEPHSGLPHRRDPTKFLTPVQAYNAAIARGVKVKAVADPNLVFQFLDSVEAVASTAGVTAKNIIYRPDCRLKGHENDWSMMRAMSAGDTSVASRKLLFKQDPNDLSRLFWHEPRTGRWHTLRAIHEGGPLPPFSDVTYARILGEAPRGRLNKQESQNLRAELYAWIRRQSKSKTGRNELAREFARIYESVPDPVDVPANGVAQPKLRVVNGDRTAAATTTGSESVTAQTNPVDPGEEVESRWPLHAIVTDEQGGDADDLELPDYSDDAWLDQ